MTTVPTLLLSTSAEAAPISAASPATRLKDLEKKRKRIEAEIKETKTAKRKKAEIQSEQEALQLKTLLGGGNSKEVLKLKRQELKKVIATIPEAARLDNDVKLLEKYERRQKAAVREAAQSAAAIAAAVAAAGQAAVEAAVGTSGVKAVVQAAFNANASSKKNVDDTSASSDSESSGSDSE